MKIFSQISKFIIFIILITLPCNAENLGNNRHLFNSYENPVYYKYFDDYMNLIGEKYSKIKFYRQNIFVGFEYKIYPDGTIQDLKTDLLTNSPMNEKKLKRLIENNPPPNFYKGMDRDYVNIEISFQTNKYCDEYNVDYYGFNTKRDDFFSINMNRKI